MSYHIIIVSFHSIAYSRRKLWSEPEACETQMQLLDAALSLAAFRPT